MVREIGANYKRGIWIGRRKEGKAKRREGKGRVDGRRKNKDKNEKEEE